MTTIAIDALGNIAADGRATCDNEIVREDREKITQAHGRIYAVTGCASLTAELIKWHHAGADAAKLPLYNGGKGWGLIVIQGDGLYFYTNTVPHAMANEYKMPVAFGSGQGWAMGAMMHGATAREAVEIACKIDTGSGGKITSMNIADALAPKLKEAAE